MQHRPARDVRGNEVEILGIILGVVVVLGIGAAIFLRQQSAKKNTFSRYEEKPVLSKDETVLFGRLCRALPNCYVFPKMPVSHLIEPAEGDRKRTPHHFERIANMAVDFAVFDGDLALVCVILLEPGGIMGDDQLQNAILERCLKSATVKAMRWSVNNKPSVEQISRSILPMTNASRPTLETGSTLNPVTAAPNTASALNPDTVQRIYKADPVPSNIRGLTQEQLDALTPTKFLSANYPHIWQRICLFAPEPKHLQKYLQSLSIQDRGEKRAGFPVEALKEITDIQMENDRFLSGPVTGWQPAFINR
ncbi:MAG: DUF2726 domain-containing protein [Burkholderiaceae bacterium]|nr:DUF2726 domain-containing protein [Burkholderiaceae bacterium]